MRALFSFLKCLLDINVKLLICRVHLCSGLRISDLTRFQKKKCCAIFFGSSMSTEIKRQGMNQNLPSSLFCNYTAVSVQHREYVRKGGCTGQHIFSLGTRWVFIRQLHAPSALSGLKKSATPLCKPQWRRYGRFV